MVYEPDKNPQIDGSEFAIVNCVPATCVMGADRASVGAKRPKTAAIRNASSDTSGGMLYGDAVDATAAVTGIRGRARYGISRADLRALVKAGHAVTISIACSVTLGTPFATNRYTGGHSVFVNSFDATHAEFMVEDPGTTAAGYLRWPEALLFAAAEKRTNGHGINVIVWPDTDGVTRTAVMTGRIRAKASTEAEDLGRIKLGDTFTVVTTVNGGPWKRANGTTAHGWHRVKVGTDFGFIRGEALR
jgi:hypothetical protein